MDTLRKISTQTFWQVLAKIFTSLSTVVVLSLVTRRYGETGTGTFTLALTYLSFFYLAVDFGLNGYILPLLIQKNGQQTWQQLLGFRLAWSLLLILLALLILPYLPFATPTFSLLVAYGSLAMLPYAVYTSANALFQSRFLYRLSSTGLAISTIISLGLTAWFIKINAPLEFLSIANTVGWFAVAGLSAYWINQRLRFNPLFDWRFILRTLSKAWPISLTLIANTLYFRADSFILSSFWPLSEVGIYNLAYQIFQAALVLPTFIMNGYYPVMIRDYSLARRRFFRELKIAGLSLLLLGVMGTLAILFLSKAAIWLIAGKYQFLGSITALNILSFGFPAFFLSSLGMWVLVLLGKYKTMLVIYVVALAVNVVANYLLIPHYSYIAAAFITTVGEYLILSLQLAMIFAYFK